jgi:hypothetical protein
MLKVEPISFAGRACSYPKISAHASFPVVQDESL